MYKYIDLFCGIGGFHQAMDRIERSSNVETKCVFAADIDEYASSIYEKNYGVYAHYNLQDEKTHQALDISIIENVNEGETIDFLFGGFPCQTFSKAGNQEGFKDETKGTLFFEIKKIVERHRPKLILLENVRNLRSHDGGNTWKVIKKVLKRLGYDVDFVIMSPNQIPNRRIPAIRDRIFIMCYRKDLKVNKNNFFHGRRLPKMSTQIYRRYNGEIGLNRRIFNNDHLHNVEESRIQIIEMWNDFRNRIIESGGRMISPIWTYYFDDDVNILDEPEWKQTIINRNREFYHLNEEVINLWFKDYNGFFNLLNASDKKFEWNAGEKVESIYDCIIQFRPSGVRVKKPDVIPTLVAINQTPILGFERRYMTPLEITKLYGFRNLDFRNQSEKHSYKQLGNTVSVDVIEFLLHNMIINCQTEG